MAEKAKLNRSRWSEAHDQVLRERYPHEATEVLAGDLNRTLLSVYNRAQALGLSKTAEFMASPASGRAPLGTGIPGSEATQFAPGTEPWNKGVKGSSGLHENSRRTQFKKGQMTGAAQHNYQPVGTERINRDGYVERKVTDDPSLVPVRRWVGVHRLVWEAANGPIPSGHAVTFRPGRRTTDVAAITLDALELVSRGELMRRNSYHTNYPKEVGQLIQLKGALQRKINRRTSREEQNG